MPAAGGVYRWARDQKSPSIWPLPGCNRNAGFGNLKIVGSVGLEPTVLPVAHRTRRIPQLDTLRGFLLVWMTLTHLPTRISAYSNQVVGYISAAEGFILLAAVLTGQIQRRANEKYGNRVARGRLFQRALRIYSYHLVLLGVAFGICGTAAVYLNRAPLQYLLDFFIAKPKTALASAPLLLYNPPLLDILPVYIIFMLLSPLLLRAAERRGWVPVLCLSAFVWLLAQGHLRGWLHAALAHRGFPIPLNEMGAFDIFAWQFLWISGLALGEVRFPAHWPKWALTSCGLVAAILFVCRHSALDKLVGPVVFDVLVDKWRLGILRLIDAVALGILILRFGSPLADSRLGAKLAVLGRASLEVFSAHLIFCFVFLGLGQGPDAHFTPWQDIAILATTLAGMYVVAWRAERQRKCAPGVQ